MTADGAAEVAGDRRLDFFQDMLTQSFPDVEVLAGYPQSHRTLALPFKRGGRMSFAARPSPPPARSRRPPLRTAAVAPAASGSRLALGASGLHVNRRDNQFILQGKSTLCLNREGIVAFGPGAHRRQ